MLVLNVKWTNEVCNHLLDQAGEDLLSFDFNNRATEQGLMDKKTDGKARSKEVELPLFSFSSVSRVVLDLFTRYISMTNHFDLRREILK